MSWPRHINCRRGRPRVPDNLKLRTCGFSLQKAQHDWLKAQPGGSSAALRSLIERAGGPRTVDVWDLRIAQDTASRAAKDIAAARAVRTPKTDPWDAANELQEPK